MEGSWRGYLQLGVIQGMMFPDAPSSSARMVETARQILLDDFFGVLVVGRMDGEAMKSVKAMADDAHAAIAISAAPVVLGGKLNLASLDAGVRAAAVEAMKKSIDDAYVLGAPIVELLDGAGNYPGSDREALAADALAGSLIDLCRYAEEKATGRPPVWVLLETFDRAVDKKSLVGPTELAVKVAAKVRASQANFGLTIDMGHLPLIGEGYRQSLEAAKDYLVHVHLGSCIKDDSAHPWFGDSHPAFGVAGGVADTPQLVEFLAALRAIGYFEKKGLPTGVPWMTFEVKPQPGQSPDLLMANCRRVFKEAWARA